MIDLCDVKNVGQYENENWYIVRLTSSLWYQKMYAGGSGLRDCFFLLRCIVGVHICTLYVYCTQFSLLKCIVGIIHCTTFTVPSSQYTGLLSGYPPFYFKMFSL